MPQCSTSKRPLVFPGPSSAKGRIRPLAALYNYFAVRRAEIGQWWARAKSARDPKLFNVQT